LRRFFANLHADAPCDRAYARPHDKTHRGGTS
jgi:hypothetical protein